MLLIGAQKQRTCTNISRRAFVQAGACSVLGLSLAQLLRLRAQDQAVQTRSARAVIFLWLWGGPSQLDTWDPKPDAPMEYRGPYASIQTRIPGVRFGELFPRIAERTNRLSIIRSLHTTSNDHGVAGTIGLTGSSAGGVGLNGQPLPGAPRPATGAVVARARGFGGRFPPYMVIGGRLHQGRRPIIGESGGTLGGMYDPLRLEYDPEHGTRIPALQLTTDLTPERLLDRQRLVRAFDQTSRHLDQVRSARVLDDYRAQAIAMLTSPDARRIFDLSRERETAREQYGYTRFGQSCLLARRLVEHAVPFVQVNWSDHVEAEEDNGDGGWDNHYRNFQLMQDRQGPWLDQAFAALLDDLHQRGLLDTTLVVAAGEFGRTPRINTKAGRDHWEHCYSALIAGGGIRAGQVVGESDRRAERPHTRPFTPADLAATIHHCVGITSEQAATLGIGVDGEVVRELV